MRRKTFTLPIDVCELIKQLANDCKPAITQSKAAEHLLKLGFMTFQEQRALLIEKDRIDAEQAKLKEDAQPEKVVAMH